MAIDYRFPDRAVMNFTKAVEADSLSPRHVRDVLKYIKMGVNVDSLIKHLKSNQPWVRKCTVQVLGPLGKFTEIITAAKVEQDKSVLLEMLKQLVKTREGLEEMITFLESEDGAVRESAIAMFRKAGRTDCLMSLLFKDDLELVERVQKYMRGDKDEKKE